MISTLRKINAIMLNIKMNQPKLVDVWICTGNKQAKFHGKILSLSENIAKSFRGWLLFLTRTVNWMVFDAEPPSGLSSPEGCISEQVIFSERELMFMFAICRRPSVCRLSVVCLSSVCL